MQVPLLTQTDAALRYFRAQQLSMDAASAKVSQASQPSCTCKCTCTCTCQNTHQRDAMRQEPDMLRRVPTYTQTERVGDAVSGGACACAGRLTVKATTCAVCGGSQTAQTKHVTETQALATATVCPGVQVGPSADPVAVFHPRLTIEVCASVYCTAVSRSLH